MQHAELEKLVMNKLLDNNNEVFADLRKQYEQATILSREFTGVGFFTTFDVHNYTPQYSCSGRIDDVAMEFPDTRSDACFILYIEKGKIDTLEGFMIGDDWDNNYDNIKVVYFFPDKRRYELN